MAGAPLQGEIVAASGVVGGALGEVGQDGEQFLRGRVARQVAVYFGKGHRPIRRPVQVLAGDDQPDVRPAMAHFAQQRANVRIEQRRVHNQATGSAALQGMKRRAGRHHVQHVSMGNDDAQQRIIRP